MLLEAGMALATHADRTLLVVIGDVQLPTNLSGRNAICLDGTTSGLIAMAARLEDAAKCPVTRRGTDWLDVQPFAQLDALKRTAPSLATHRSSTGGESDVPTALSVFVRQWTAGPHGQERYVEVVASNISGAPLTVVSMGLRMESTANRGRPWRVDDGAAKPKLPTLLRHGETVAMTWMLEELGAAFYNGQEVTVGCFALDGRGIEVVHALPEPVGLGS